MFFPYISYIWGNMSLSVVSITLNIRNNRTYPQRINVLGSPVNPLDTANALTEYRWDITAFTPSSSDTLTLEYKPLGASVFSTYTYLLSNPNSEALVAALNGLGIGYFNYYTELGQNYLSTNNDDYVFGNLTINSNVPVTPTTSTTTTTTTAAPTTTSTTTTTTTAAFVSFSLGYSVVDGNTACATGAGTYYASSGSTLQNGTIIYTDSALTTPAPVGYYSDGLNWWFISGGGLAGELSSETLCGSTTTSTTTTTTTAASTTTTSTTSTTTTATPTCNNYNIEGAPSIDVQWLECDGTTNSATVTTAIVVCAQTGSVSQTGGAGNITQLGTCTSPTTTSTTTTTTTAATTSTTTTTTTAAPATSTTTTTTTAAITTSTTSTTTTLFTNLFFDASVGVGGYTIGSIDVNGVTPTLTSGTNVPFNTDGHGFNTTQVGTNETLNIFVSVFTLNGCITVTDSASNVFQQNINASGTYSFTGLNIDNTTAVQVICADNVC